MMKRLFMLLSLALMVGAAMALSGVAQAASPTAKCKQAAVNSGLNLTDLTGYKFVAGSDKKNDNFTSKNTAGADVFCGFGGNDEIANIDADDIFIGGAGGDATAGGANYGIFYGGDGSDGASYNYGTLYGDAGDDYVQFNEGFFYGGAGSDGVDENRASGTFYGEGGGDSVFDNYGTFDGGDGDDTVTNVYSGGLVSNVP